MSGPRGAVYLLHFERPYQHARHYLGWTADLEARLIEHRAGRGSPLIRAAADAGIGFVVSRTWPGDRSDEWRLQRMKDEPDRLCPVCRRLCGGDGAAGAN
ncbi:MAG TPA: hypothetical protein VGF21_02030 [Thermoleophilaceae bacterium]|jgi:hypothetical protein